MEVKEEEEGGGGREQEQQNEKKKKQSGSSSLVWKQLLPIPVLPYKVTNWFCARARACGLVFLRRCHASPYNKQQQQNINRLLLILLLLVLLSVLSAFQVKAFLWPTTTLSLPRIIASVLCVCIYASHRHKWTKRIHICYWFYLCAENYVYKYLIGARVKSP